MVAVLGRVSRSYGHRLRLRALHLDTLLQTADSAPARKGRVWLSAGGVGTRRHRFSLKRVDLVSPGSYMGPPGDRSAAAQAGGPPGRWWGPGAEALGFRTGQVVERGPYELVYRQVDPRTGEKLGRSRGNYAKFADHLARLQAAEPHATAERLQELEREAAQATRQAPVTPT